MLRRLTAGSWRVVRELRMAQYIYIEDPEDTLLLARGLCCCLHRTIPSTRQIVGALAAEIIVLFATVVLNCALDPLRSQRTFICGWGVPTVVE